VVGADIVDFDNENLGVVGNELEKLSGEGLLLGVNRHDSTVEVQKKRVSLG